MTLADDSEFSGDFAGPNEECVVHAGHLWETSEVDVETSIESMEPSVHLSDLNNLASGADLLATPHTFLQSWYPFEVEDATGF